MIPALLILLNLTVLAACAWFAVKVMRQVVRGWRSQGQGRAGRRHPLAIVPLRPPAEGRALWRIEVALLAAIVLLGLAYALGVA